MKVSVNVREGAAACRDGTRRLPACLFADCAADAHRAVAAAYAVAQRSLARLEGWPAHWRAPASYGALLASGQRQAVIVFQRYMAHPYGGRMALSAAFQLAAARFAQTPSPAAAEAIYRRYLSGQAGARRRLCDPALVAGVRAMLDAAGQAPPTCPQSIAADGYSTSGTCCNVQATRTGDGCNIL